VGASSAISVFWLAMTAGRMVCTALSSVMRPQTFVLALCVGGSIAAAGIAASPSPAACYATVALSGLFFSGIFAMVLAHAGKILGGHLGAAFGIIISGIAFGSMVIPAAMGWVAEAVGMRIALLMPAVALTAQVILYIPYVVRRNARSADTVLES